jgi:hypothetical protein
MVTPMIMVLLLQILKKPDSVMQSENLPSLVVLLMTAEVMSISSKSPVFVLIFLLVDRNVGQQCGRLHHTFIL